MVLVNALSVPPVEAIPGSLHGIELHSSSPISPFPSCHPLGPWSCLLPYFWAPTQQPQLIYFPRPLCPKPSTSPFSAAHLTQQKRLFFVSHPRCARKDLRQLEHKEVSSPNTTMTILFLGSLVCTHNRKANLPLPMPRHAPKTAYPVTSTGEPSLVPQVGSGFPLCVGARHCRTVPPHSPHTGLPAHFLLNLSLCGHLHLRHQEPRNSWDDSTTPQQPQGSTS